MRRLVLIGSLAFTCALALAPLANATVTVGRTGAPLDGPCDGGFDWMEPTVPSGNSYVMPYAGTITSWTMDAAGMTGSQFTAKVFRKVGDPDTYQVVGHAGPGTLSDPGRNTFPASIQVHPGDVLGFHSLTDNSPCALDDPNATILFYPALGSGDPPDLPDGASGNFATDSGYGLNIEATLDPDNTFAIGPVARNKRKGTATATLTVPNPGTVAVGGKGVQGVSASEATSGAVAAPGTVMVPIRAKGKSKKALSSKGRVKVTARITYTPTSGTARTVPLKVKLKKKLKQ